MEKNEILVDVRHLVKWFPIKKSNPFGPQKYVKAVDDVSFAIRKGETLGLVGESGCGKSTLARTMLRLIEPTSGEVLFDNEDFLAADRKRTTAMRKDLQIVFQDPFGSLHPKMKVGQILEAPMVIQRYGNRNTRAARVRELIDMVDLKPEHLSRYPHEFSGGQRQRIVIARALAMSPRFVVCDEPVSALDVSVRSQILNLLEDLQKSLGLTYLFISHDLSVVEHICDRIVVMYLGKVMESTSCEELFRNPLHPYTQALLSAVPQVFAKDRKEHIPVEGDIPSPANPPPGCRFHTRCPQATDACREDVPLRDVGGGHLVACRLVTCAKENVHE
ncbi:MAG TPA: dipeptide ABC transporter ATP-binding protein [Clostridia bacterium]|nr:dipeptide ABC transporter ATP-binding protein [Clostridia bacterium]